MNQDGWNIVLVGIPWWVVLPAAFACGSLLLVLQRHEIAHLSPRRKASLRALRLISVSAVLLLLLEPTLTHDRSLSQKPAIAVVVDTSGSMAATDAHMAAIHRLDEATALGLIEPNLRPDVMRRAADALVEIRAEMPTMIAAASVPNTARARASASAARGRIASACATRARMLRDLVGGLAGHPEFAQHMGAHLAILDRVAAALSADAPGSPVDPALASDAAALGEGAGAIHDRLLDAQAAADAALVSGADAASPIAQGLERFSRLSRCERAIRLVRDTIVPELEKVAEVSVVALADRAPRLDLDPAHRPNPGGTTDFSQGLSYLAREWPQGSTAHIGGVVLVSDGRQTAGSDAIPAVRALAARGARVATICVGDPDVPRDAVVAELSGSPEVFKGEIVRLDARVRISGYGQTDWDLVLSCDGMEVDRRTIRGTGTWQSERFENGDAVAGLHTWEARLERSSVSASLVRAGGGLNREVWSGIAGASIQDLLIQPGFDQRPTESAIVESVDVQDNRENYGERLRGYVIPPASGWYTFWISGDDACELRLALGSDQLETRVLASVPEYTDTKIWDRFESQRSKPVFLQAGKAYYIEALHKQGLGAGHVAVGWQLPDNKLERPIPAIRLAPAERAVPAQPVDIADQPEASMANNVARCSIAVIDDPLKVLVVDATPRWESRYLVGLFERDRRVDVDRRYRSVRLARAEHVLLPQTQGAIDLYDVIVIGDLTATEITTEDQTRLERFVSNRGGFLVCISGPRGMPASFGLGALASVLPVRTGTAATAAQGPVTVALPTSDAGGSHDAITTVLDDPALNRRLWPALPPLQWSIPGVTAKPGALVLLEGHGALPGPIAVANRSGAGRVLWMGSDETWRWRDKLGDRVHQTFWLQAVRWGVGSRLRGQDVRLQAAIDRILIEPDESVELRARARHGDGSEASVPRATLSAIDDRGTVVAMSEQQLALQPVIDAEGIYHASIGSLTEGRWRIVITSDHPQHHGLSEIRELIVRQRGSREGIELASDPAHLAHLAAAGGFRSGGMDQARAIARDLARGLRPTLTSKRSTWSLWNGYGALVVITALLACEWLWRKRLGLP
ncbi:MAG: hypothetical protein H0V44_03510 [Planctomycetes bacterium]|nr:hypothetical protein [Planctomycetota bacterium]